MEVYSVMMVVQKAFRKGVKNVVGRGRRREARVVGRWDWVVVVVGGWGVW